MDAYRPARRSAAPDAWSEDMYKDHDDPSSESVRMREFERSDPYTERQDYRPRSLHRGGPGDGRRGETRGRDGRYDREWGAPVEYQWDGGDGDALRYYQDGRPPPAKRPYRGRDRYEEDDYYADPAIVDVPYRGENDVSLDGRPMRLLLIRNLKESMTEELFAKGLEKLNLDTSTVPSEGPQVGATEGSLRRVLIIRDRQTDKSMHFGFAEYHSVSDATAALAKADEMGDKCTISSKVVEVNFPHLTVFPRADFGGQERSEKYTIEMASMGQQHKYHDERYYPSEMIVNAEAPQGRGSPAKDERADKAGSVAGGTLENKDKAGSVAGGTLENKDKSKKRKAPGATAPAFLQHWQNKAAELRTEEQKVQAERDKGKAEKASRLHLPASGVNTMLTPAAPTQSDQQTFVVDTSKLKCCYLCASQFQTSEGLQRHLKESAKHAEALARKEATAKGYERLKKANVSPHATIRLLTLATLPAAPASAAASAADDQAYRDRAAERRRIESQSASNSGKDPTGLPSFSLKPQPKSTPLKPSTSASPSTTTKPSYGKGLNLLQKAGWTAGQGLGAAGNWNGIVQPIEQSLYASGVGLGHEGGKKGDAVEEAGRMTRGESGGFLEKTREVARERFARMG